MKLRCIIMAATIAVGTLYAQGPYPYESRAASGGGTATPATPAQTAQRDTARLTRFFSLTTAQQSTVLGILTTAETHIQTLATQIQPLQTALVAAVKANSQSQIGSTLLQLSNLQEQEQVIRANAAGQIYATVLTTSQQGQLGTGLGPLLSGGPGGGPGGGGFRGPR